MSTNERLQEIDGDSLVFDEAVQVELTDYLWMYDKIKQLQEDVETANQKEKTWKVILESERERIAELEKENEQLKQTVKDVHDKNKKLDAIWSNFSLEDNNRRKRIAELEKELQSKKDWGCFLVEGTLDLQDKIEELLKEKDIIIHDVVAELIWNLDGDIDRYEAIDMAEEMVNKKLEEMLK